MSSEQTTRMMAMKGPVARKARIFSILGSVFIMSAALLMACLFIGLAQAADNDIGLNNNGISTNGKYPGIINMFASGQAPEPEDSGDMANCGEHDVKCFDKDNNLLGVITNGPCYYDDYECDSRSGKDLIRCQTRFGDIAVSSKPLTYCHWRSA